MARRIQTSGHSPTQLHLLTVLDAIGPTPMSQVAEFVGISPASATAIVDRMIDDSLVARGRSEDDRRQVLVSITRQGRDLLQRAVSSRREQLESVFEHLRDDELAQIVRIMQRLESAIEARRESEAHTS